MLAIAPYYCGATQTWVFDDPNAGLEREPFVAGVPAMIDHLVRDIPNARDGFRMIFSAVPFPGYQQEAVREYAESGGAWYRTVEPPLRGWLCPALFRYFDRAPERLYVRSEPLG
jgi:hypothetical protein